MLLSIDVGRTTKNAKVRERRFSTEPSFVRRAIQGTIQDINNSLSSFMPKFWRNFLGVKHTTYQFHDSLVVALCSTILLGVVQGCELLLDEMRVVEPWGSLTNKFATTVGMDHFDSVAGITKHLANCLLKTGKSIWFSVNTKGNSITSSVIPDKKTVERSTNGGRIDGAEKVSVKEGTRLSCMGAS
jgi:hypothetical protein